MDTIFKQTYHSKQVCHTKKKKRKRNKIPTYKKFYSVFLYDREKFRQFLNYNLKHYKCHIKRNQWEILDLCYIRDENNKRCHNTDEKFIFRYKTLHRIYELIYLENVPDLESDIVIKDGIIFWKEELQAELQGTWDLPLKQRLFMHIDLLRRLRKEKKGKVNERL